MHKTKVYYFFFTCFNENLFKCLNLLISSDFLLNMLLSLMWLVIQCVSVKHNSHIAELGLPLTLINSFPLNIVLNIFFKFQTNFVNSVLY